MLTTSIFPGRYIQGDQAIDVLPEEVARLGNSAFAIVDKVFIDDLQNMLAANAHSIKTDFELFNGECSDTEITRLGGLIDSLGGDVVIGVGGGKTLDTAKAVAYQKQLPVIIVPTIASTDAPCSALSVIYNDDGSFNRYLILPQNPNAVLVDTGLISQAPCCFLIAGMGDAFATWFEAEDCRIKRGTNMTGRSGPVSAYALAHFCHETLLEYSSNAKLACQNKVVTPALEHVVEANTLLSGLGFESGGLAAAHAIHNGLTTMSGTHDYYHGEKVAIGVQAMMFLSDRSSDMIDLVYDYCEGVGLPTTLADIGLTDVSSEDIDRIALTACAKGETIHNEPHEVTPRRVAHCLVAADAEGRRRRRLALPTNVNRCRKNTVEILR